jgi:hypothetical protein
VGEVPDLGARTDGRSRIDCYCVVSEVRTHFFIAKIRKVIIELRKEMFNCFNNVF